MSRPTYLYRISMEKYQLHTSLIFPLNLCGFRVHQVDLQVLSAVTTHLVRRCVQQQTSRRRNHPSATRKYSSRCSAYCFHDSTACLLHLWGTWNLIFALLYLCKCLVCRDIFRSWLSTSYCWLSACVHVIADRDKAPGAAQLALKCPRMPLRMCSWRSAPMRCAHRQTPLPQTTTRSATMLTSNQLSTILCGPHLLLQPSLRECSRQHYPRPPVLYPAPQEYQLIDLILLDSCMHRTCQSA